MKKIGLILLFVTLTACRPTQQPPRHQPTAQPAIADTSQVSPAGTPIASPPTPATAQEPAPTPPAGVEAMECTLVSASPEPDSTSVSLFPPVSESDWTIGPANAALTIIEYGDFQCPACAQLAPVLAQLQADFPDDVRLVYRHFPLITVYDKSALATQAAEAAGEQGKFWEMHQLLYQRQNEWAVFSEDDFRTWVIERAGELGLDREQFTAALTSEKNKTLAQNAFDAGVRIGLPGTPFLLINGRIYDGPTDYSSLSTIIRLYALERMQYRACPPMVIDPTARYTAIIQTEKGDIIVELFPDIAPLAVNNFVFLARNGWYDGVTFHLVLPGLFAQTGDPSGTGFGGPGYAFRDEISTLKFDRAGVVGMVNAGPDTNGAQFFITLGPVPDLDGRFTIFGQVIEGIEIAQKLSARNPGETVNPPPGDKIITITIEEK